MYRKSLLLSSGVRFIPIQEIGSFVDGLFNFCVLSYVNCFEFLDRPYYHYRKTNASAATANYRKNFISRQLTLFGIIMETIEKEKAWDFYKEAFSSHLVYATMEIVFNAMRNKVSFWEKYKETKEVLSCPIFTQAYKDFSLKNLGIKWKVYFFFIKHSMTLPVYMMTSIILKLKSKGIA